MEWLDDVVVLLVVGFVVWVFWRSLQPRRVFVVRIGGGQPRVVAGKVTPAFLRHIGDVAHENGVRDGRVSGVERGRRIGLEFSRQFPAAGRQQLRNSWAVLGWGNKR